MGSWPMPAPKRLMRGPGSRRETRAHCLLRMDIATDFVDFADYWSPFLGAQGPAPGYVASVDEAARAALRERIRAALPVRARWLDPPRRAGVVRSRPEPIVCTGPPPFRPQLA